MIFEQTTFKGSTFHFLEDFIIVKSKKPYAKLDVKLVHLTHLRTED